VNILFCSVPFRPSVGGIETVSELLAERFQRTGHSVVLATQTGASSADTGDLRIVRRPNPRQLFELVQWADVVFHNNISLRFAWPQLFLSRPWVIAHHTWIPTRGLAGRLKRFVLRYAQNIAVSDAVARSLPMLCVVVPNPYADDRFVRLAGTLRDRELLFVGRLVSDKGVGVLIDALAALAERGQHACLTVIGDGPEEPALRQQAQALGVADQVDFAGRRTGDDLVWALNAHRVLVVPSMWEEPFGVVALEAIACGCVPLVARSGGLPDAVGACGRVVPKGDRQALATAMGMLLDQPTLLECHRAGAAAHLARHTRDRVARDYLKVLDDAHRAGTHHRSARAV